MNATLTSTLKRPRGRPRKKEIDVDRPKRPNGRPRVENKLTQTERQRVYMLDPEKKERQRLAAQRYRAKVKAARARGETPNLKRGRPRKA